MAFEQSYSGVEGDLAVTGSVDQLRQVQAVGSVNEKIEGFFDVCSQRGLTGRQAVILPQTNVQHLMLRKEVVDALCEGRFQVYAVADVDAVMALLSGHSPGRVRGMSEFPPKSINGRVQQCLADFAQLHMAFAGAAREPAAEDDKIAAAALKKAAKG